MQELGNKEVSRFHFWEYINGNPTFILDSHWPFICSVPLNLFLKSLPCTRCCGFPCWCSLSCSRSQERSSESDAWKLVCLKDKWRPQAGDFDPENPWQRAVFDPGNHTKTCLRHVLYTSWRIFPLYNDCRPMKEENRSLRMNCEEGLSKYSYNYVHMGVNTKKLVRSLHLISL